ncbi:MAG: hypothetical protein ACUVTU_07625 [Desulfurispora sp.]|uniref:hypothetical protein n=1 Tax=Desulfurispora sp. TaxID=3014275 RepID=UPI0040490938
MSRQTVARFNKELRSFFTLPLAGYPVTCKITNINLTAELQHGRKILAIGQYDLVFCYTGWPYLNNDAYDTIVTTRTFCQEMGEITKPPDEVEVRIYFSQPLQVHTREGKPAGSGLLDALRNFISRTKWTEVRVEGRITAEVVPAQKTRTHPDDPLPVQETAAASPAPPPANPEMLVEAVLKAIQRWEEEKNTARQAPPPSPPKAAPVKNRAKVSVPPSFIFPTPKDSSLQIQAPLATPPDKNYKIAEHLAQIPGRPGLEKHILPGYPPPKPPGKGG